MLTIPLTAHVFPGLAGQGIFRHARSLDSLVLPNSHIKTGHVLFTHRAAAADEGNGDIGQLELMGNFRKSRHGGGH